MTKCTHAFTDTVKTAHTYTHTHISLHSVQEKTDTHLGYKNKQFGKTSCLLRLWNSSYCVHKFLRCVITATAEQSARTHIHTLPVNGKLIAVYSLNSVLVSVKRQISSFRISCEDLFHTCRPPCSACLSVFQRQTKKRECLKTDRSAVLEQICSPPSLIVFSKVSG